MFILCFSLWTEALPCRAFEILPYKAVEGLWAHKACNELEGIRLERNVSNLHH